MHLPEPESFKRLVLATKNQGKVREFQALLARSDIELVGLDPDSPDVEETGTTFEENALIKARTACRRAGLPALAEDSGLAVDALSGEPGVRSARWVSGSDDDRNQALLERMKGIPKDRRTGQYISCIAIVTPNGREEVVRGEWDGAIGFAPSGTGGFGYDPIFYLPDGRSVGMISLAEKNAISHRSQALAKVAQRLSQLMGE